jgi:hypothetical protein
VSPFPESVPLLRLLRLANPLVRVVLHSRAHGLLSGRLVLLTYEGHRSGRTFRIPVRYAMLGDARLVAIAVRPERKLWWRSFAEPRAATVLLRRLPVEVVGTLADGDVGSDARAAYAARYPRSARLVDAAAVVVFERRG